MSAHTDETPADELGVDELGPGEDGTDTAAPGALCARTIKGLAMDAVQKANSGHPGAPMGMADIATVLWTGFVKYDPTDATWPDRDRVVLSNGHASMLLYSMLHLTGTALSLDDLVNFRQWGSVTAGHPEYGFAPGIETTTGPLGQGVANGVGMAMAEAWLAARFGPELVDHRTWVLCGDGCLMEGIAQEACSLAGHLGLHKLTLLYDDNRITIDGTTDLSFSEDVAARFRALGWHTVHVDGHDQSALARAMQQAIDETGRPTLVCCRTVIAAGSPHKAGSEKSHGAPLGVDEVRATKLALGMDPDATFVVPDEVVTWVRRRDHERRALRAAWERRLAESEQAAAWAAQHGGPDLDGVDWPRFPAGKSVATRKAGETVLQAVAAAVPALLGGSADLAGSNGSTIKGSGFLRRDDFRGRNIHFGIREHAMAAVCNGLSLHGGAQPYCATFLTFHDYMRPSVRLSAIMHQPVVYVYTHDSVFVGEDGPTHQPVEHIASMRSMPNLWVVRPCDANETTEAWRMALARRDGPTALCLSRQNLPVTERTERGIRDDFARGAYVFAEASSGEPAVVLVATGSEVALAAEAREALEADGVPTRVVSMPCAEAFDLQEAAWRNSVLPAGVPRVSIEAGVTWGWERHVGAGGASVGIDRFGASAPGEVVADKLGLNVPNIVATARRVLGTG